MFPEGKQCNKNLNYRIMELTNQEIKELKALLYKEIMNLERENNIEKVVFFREMYNKIKGLTRA